MSRRPTVSNTSLTRERIAEDIADFERAGGRVEILGTTRALKTISPPEPTIDMVAPSPPAAPAKPGKA